MESTGEFERLHEVSRPADQTYTWVEYTFSNRKFKKRLGIKHPGRITSVFVDIFTNNVKVTLSNKGDSQ